MTENKKENTNWNAILFIIFWLAVMVECAALYKRSYIVYGFSRVFLAPILLVRAIGSQNARKLSAYMYLFLLFSILADLLSIFGNERAAYIGLNLFTVSFLCVGCYFQQLKDNHNYSHRIIFLLAVIIISSACALWLYAPEIHKQTFYIQIAFHGLVLLFMLYSFFASIQKLSATTFYLFLFTLFFIIIGNSIYGLDAFYLHWRYSIVEAFIGLSNGIYLFTLVRGALRSIKKG